MNHIYLDHNASTPIDPLILKVLVKELEEEIGNPSSIHFHGQQCRRKMEQCRQSIARFFKVKPSEIIFTSGGTEGASLLLKGIIPSSPKPHIITSKSEHPCVYETVQELRKGGAEVTFLPTDLGGCVCPKDVEQAIHPQTSLITLMAANNETGVMTDISAIAEIAERANVPFIVDGVAWLGKEKIHIPTGVSGLFFSGHKIHAPKGIGFCICRNRVKLNPLFIGGGQENNRRCGTENLPGIVALAKAISLLEEGEDEIISHMRKMRDYFESEICSRLPNVVINGSGPRVSNTSNIAFLGVDGETLLFNLDQKKISVSHGSACSSGALEPSRILLEMGISLSQARSSLRFSFARSTTEEEIERALSMIVCEVEHLRAFKARSSESLKKTD